MLIVLSIRRPVKNAGGSRSTSTRPSTPRRKRRSAHTTPASDSRRTGSGVFKAKASNLNRLAEETGGEVLSDKPELLNHVFNDLIDHLRTRYVIGFVSSNTKRDGTFRKIKLDVAQPSTKPEDRLVVRTRRGYVAAKTRPGDADKPRTR